MNVSTWFTRYDDEPLEAHHSRLLRLYAEYRPIWQAVRRPMDRERYGYLGHDAEHNYFPKHANGRYRPRPIHNPYTGLYEPAKFRMRDLIRCLHAEPGDYHPAFFFYTNRQDEVYPEMVIDIDAAEHAVDDSAARRVGDHIIGDVFGCLPTFSEPSRNGKGRYVRFIVRREYEPPSCTSRRRAEAAREFNRLMLQFGLVLRKKYPKGASDAHVDNVKALLHWREKRIDDATYYASSELGYYEYTKSTGRFEYEEGKERYREGRGVLGTMALAGALAHGDHERVERYLKFAKARRETFRVGDVDVRRVVPLNSIPQSFFREYVEANRGLVPLRPRGFSRPDHSLVTLISTTPPPSTHYLSIGGSPPPASLEAMRSEPDSFRRVQWTVIEVFALLRRPASVAECMDRYVQWGLALSSHEDRTQRRFEDVVKWYTPIFVEGGGKRSVGFAVQYHHWLGVIQSHVRPEYVVRAKAAERCQNRITDTDLAIVLYLITMNSLRPSRPRPEWLFTTPEKAVLRLFERLYDDGLTPTRCDKRKCRSIKRALVEAGLICPLYVDDPTGTLWSVERHVGRAYGLGVHHPQHAQFRQLYETVRQARVFPPTGRVTDVDEDALEREARIATSGSVSLCVTVGSAADEELPPRPRLCGGGEAMFWAGRNSTRCEPDGVTGMVDKRTISGERDS